jgi:hypothetical protein
MTEAEWMACTDPDAMWGHLHYTSRSLPLGCPARGPVVEAGEAGSTKVWGGSAGVFTARAEGPVCVPS